MNTDKMQSELTLEDVSVSFPIYHGGSRSLKKSLLFRSSGGHLARDASQRTVVEALRNVSTRIAAGDRVALIGSNGAGKTTLLRVMAGIYEPVAGTVRSRGMISPMLDIGLGIDHDMSGYENIRMRGLILGMTPDDIAGKLQDIFDFTELGEYLDLPVRTYSSGMITRLTFAVATCFAPEILLMDEWIMAGDVNFITKARHRIDNFVAKASILVLASHSAETCRQFCNKALWMDQGIIKAAGSLEEILELYREAQTNFVELG